MHAAPRSVDLLVPCFNEEETAVPLMQELSRVLEMYSRSGSTPIAFRLIVVDDGSTDATVAAFERLIRTSRFLSGGQIIALSRNFGKEAAILAGLRHCEADACVILDADLQDPPALLPEMIAVWLEGFQVVNAVRKDRSSDNAIKRLTSGGFYSVFLRLSKLKIQHNASDFRLLDRVAIDAVLSCEERIRFSKGFFAWIGFDQKNIYFTRPARESGVTKWNEWKLWNYALDGIFSFTTAPLRIWSYLGLAFTIASFVVGMTAVLRVVFFGIDVPGYASLFCAVTFLGGLQLIGIGILGEYVGRTYVETKRRPIYVVKALSRIAPAAADPRSEGGRPA